MDSTSSSPVEFATIALIDPATKKTVDGTIAEAGGKFTLSKVAGGKYTVSVTATDAGGKVVGIWAIFGNC